MANILQRPMFRRGGSAAKGTGITSGLTERKQYADGPDLNDILAGGDAFGIKAMPAPKSEAEMLTDIRPGIYDLDLFKKSQQQQQPQTPGELQQQLEVINQMKERFQPTGTDVMDDTMAAIASTTPDDPTKLQTFGQFLGKAGTAATGLRRQREEGVRKFEKEATLEVIKNLSKDEKDQLFRYANERARLLKIPPEKRSVQDNQRLEFLDRYLKGVPRKGIDFQARKLDISDRLTKPRSAGGAYGYSKSQADNIAKVQIAIEQSGGKIPPANYGPKDGNYTGKAPGRYIDADTATIVLWDGKNKKQVYP